MSDVTPFDELRERASHALKRLAGLCDEADLADAKQLVENLRNNREYEPMGRLAEAISRLDPKDARNRRLYAQYLIEDGKATAAIDLLKRLIGRLPKDHAESAEATGLLGRAYKQIFFDAGDKTSAGACQALKQAIAAYRAPYEEDRLRNTWHGVNLLALLTRARRLGLRVAPDLNPRDVAQTLVKDLNATPKELRNEWFLPTLAEASLGLHDWDAVDRNIHAYAADESAKAFLIASTLRQFTQVWDLEAVDERGGQLVDILRARLAEMPGGTLEIEPADIQRLRRQPMPDDGQLEAVLGNRGPETYRWWKCGLERALSVAAVCRKLGTRHGTGFLVRAGDFALEPANELLVLTNFHVVNEHGATPGIRPEEAEILFEAVEANRPYLVEKILWTSPPDRHDASLLRLQTPVTGLTPLMLAASLPTIEDTARVYVIGHPGGRELAFSFQDNELLDHEGPPGGNPQIPGVCRVHYRAPTEGGSSGSPVFNSMLWEVIALHHKGGQIGVPRLNGISGHYAANEGIGLQSIRQAIAEG